MVILYTMHKLHANTCMCSKIYGLYMELAWYNHLGCTYAKLIFNTRIRLWLLPLGIKICWFACWIQEIAWQRLDELQPASNDVISRGMTGLKLYMVSPFLTWVKCLVCKPGGCPQVVSLMIPSTFHRSLRSWISAHQPPVAPRLDRPSRGAFFLHFPKSSLL